MPYTPADHSHQRPTAAATESARPPPGHLTVPAHGHGIRAAAQAVRARCRTATHDKHRPAARNLKPSLILLDIYAWRWGARRYADMLDIAKDFTLDPARITCPLLSIVGEKEYTHSAVSRKFQDDAIRANRNPESRLIVVKGSDGGDAHAIGTNLSLMAQLVFDWLDQVLSAKPSASTGLVRVSGG
jgi:pimeloyl-ACP methyl ester carboxylesterase